MVCIYQPWKKNHICGVDQLIGLLRKLICRPNLLDRIPLHVDTAISPARVGIIHRYNQCSMLNEQGSHDSLLLSSKVSPSLSEETGVGTVFITSAFRILPRWIRPERGRDKYCPYHLPSCFYPKGWRTYQRM